MAYWMINGRPIDPNEETGRGCCSECGGDSLKNEIEDPELSRYCPHCGAKMENWQGEEQREAAYEKEEARWRKKQEERLAAMTPEERAIRDAWMSSVAFGTTGPCWREEDGE